jgi:hypothetical protein
VQILCQRWRKTTNAGPTTLIAGQQQANPLLSVNNYTPLMISENDKNMQLTLLSQFELVVAVRNTLFAL